MNTGKLNHEMMVAMHRFRKLGTIPLYGVLTRSEFCALEVMRTHQSRSGIPGVYVSELAEKLEVSPPAVSRMLRSMEENEWIVREVEHSDRRNTRVTATALGVEKARQTKEILDGFTDRVAQRLGEQDTQHLLMLINRLADAVEAELLQTMSLPEANRWKQTNKGEQPDD